jgi:NAD(P)-dependent dehydrogenase (short-subunit alcohol dehydrogenase family)
LSSQLVDLTGAIVMVTGSGGGLGRAFALEFARHGASVAINDLDAAAAEGTVQAIEASGGRARAFVADVTDERAVAGMVASIEGEMGPLRILVNNAGITRFEGDAYLDLGGWRRTLAHSISSARSSAGRKR